MGLTTSRVVGGVLLPDKKKTKRGKIPEKESTRVEFGQIPNVLVDSRAERL